MTGLSVQPVTPSLQFPLSTLHYITQVSSKSLFLLFCMKFQVSKLSKKKKKKKKEPTFSVLLISQRFRILAAFSSLLQFCSSFLVLLLFSIHWIPWFDLSDTVKAHCFWVFYLSMFMFGLCLGGEFDAELINLLSLVCSSFPPLFTLSRGGRECFHVRFELLSVASLFLILKRWEIRINLFLVSSENVVCHIWV